MLKKFKKIFRRRHPITIVAYLGKKNVEKIYDAKIMDKDDLIKLSQGQHLVD